MDGGAPSHGQPQLSWTNVGFAFAFIALDAVISRAFRLGLGNSLITAAVRCIGQLVLIALILQKVFQANDPWAASGIGFLLNLMGTVEAVVIKPKLRFRHMFLAVLFSMVISSVPVAIIGVRYCMSTSPFWKPSQYIPVMGMLCGNNISGIVVASEYILQELQDNRDKVETYLAFGASRYEACKPIAIEALRLALIPMINAMSVIGIISIPGTMTGAILGGSSVEQAARLQMVMMFLIMGSMALSAIVTTLIVLSIIIDAEHRTRPDRIDSSIHVVWRIRSWLYVNTVGRLVSLGSRLLSCLWTKRRTEDAQGERDRLLG